MRNVLIVLALAALLGGCAMTTVSELKADPRGIERTEVPRDYKAAFTSVRRYVYDCFLPTPSLKPSSYLDLENKRGEVVVSADFHGALIAVDVVPSGADSSTVTAYYRLRWQEGAQRAVQAASGPPPDC